MNKTKLMFAAVAVCVTLAACAKKDFNAITGTDTSQSISLSNDSASYHIFKDSTVAFSPVATLEPQNVAIGNGTTNMTFTFANPAIAEINGDGNLQGDAVGTTTLTITYTDVVHNFTTTSIDVPVTVLANP